MEPVAGSATSPTKTDMEKEIIESLKAAAMKLAEEHGSPSMVIVQGCSWSSYDGFKAYVEKLGHGKFATTIEEAIALLPTPPDRKEQLRSQIAEAQRQLEALEAP